MNIHPIDRFRLDGRITFITGASSGLGAHFARVLAQAGGRIALAARSMDKLYPLVDVITKEGGEAIALSLDVTSSKSVSLCFDELEAQWGSPDIVVNNAGTTVTRSLLEQTEADYDLVIDTNLKGNWLVATEAARRMSKADRGGSIVNIASILGERVAGGVAPYAISKAGVVQATKAMALELARYHIRVNALLPGYVATDLNRDFLASYVGQNLQKRIPTRRFGDLADLDGPLLLLASDAGSAMTGAVVAVDGGHLVSSL